ncbi:MAG: metallopeptidase TldD-related protein [Candidatus Thorarchaeota archaeon]
MGVSLLNTIENKLHQKKIEQYEILLVENDILETIFKKNEIDNEREIRDFEYIIRILKQKGNGTGIGIVKGCNRDPEEIGKNIDICISLSNSNFGSKYEFPHKTSYSNINIADNKIVKNPVEVKNELSSELISEIQCKKDVLPTFGRFRVHSKKNFLRNHNGLDLEALKTYIFVEFSLKAQKNSKLSEFWLTEYYKEISHFNIKKEVEKWAKIAKDTLIAKLPNPKSKTVIIFPPHVLREAINPVIGYHVLGKSNSEKTSLYKIGDEVASENFTLIDNGLLKGGFRTNSFDGEGNPQQKNIIIKDGIFERRLYDQKYAILENKISTGNGIRSMEGSIYNDVSNLQIIPGDISLDEIISNVKEGYYIERFSWLNPGELSGDFGAEVRNGYYIKNGRILNPIKGGNVSGNVLKMVNNCKYISKECEFSLNSYFPYICFTNLSISS